MDKTLEALGGKLLGVLSDYQSQRILSEVSLELLEKGKVDKEPEKRASP